MQSRKGTGIVVGLATLASLGIITSAVGSFLPHRGAPTGTPAAAVSRLNGKPASSKQLDGWIRDALEVMEQENIPGSYQGIHRNVIRESGGNPTICNTTDINARNGTPSCGLLQTIRPTFEAHKLPQSAYDRAGVEADANNMTDPVANIVTACAYAWSRYPDRGGIDGINGAY